MHRPNALDSQIQEFLSRLTERQIAILLLNIQRDPAAYPLAAAQTQEIRELARREIRRQRVIGQYRS